MWWRQENFVTNFTTKAQRHKGNNMNFEPLSDREEEKWLIPPISSIRRLALVYWKRFMKYAFAMNFLRNPGTQTHLLI